MPEPMDGETKEAFISRCIRAVRKEGTTHATNKGTTYSQAIIGKCYGLWNTKHGSK
jgi:hypothetical protein